VKIDAVKKESLLSFGGQIPMGFALTGRDY